MALRDDLVTLVDEIRDEVIDGEVGLRLYAVATRLRTWDGGKVGSGTASDTDTDIEPKPKVQQPSPRLVVAAPGKFEEGDRIVSRISATYEEDDLDGGTLDAGDEFFWLLDGEPYRVVGKPEKRYLEWRVHLRRMRPR